MNMSEFRNESRHWKETCVEGDFHEFRVRVITHNGGTWKEGRLITCLQHGLICIRVCLTVMHVCKYVLFGYDFS